NNKYSNLYIKFLQKFIDIKKPIRVVFDCFNGSTGPVLSQLFKTHKFLTNKLINSRPDGRFPGHGPNPLLKGKMRQLKKEVIKSKADLGVAFDADGDRAFFIDNLGRPLPSYLMAYLLFLFLRPPFVVDNLIFESLKSCGFLEQNKRKIFISAVGSYFVKKLMRRKSADFGAEYSGHYYFKISDSGRGILSSSPNKSEFYFDSGILATIKALNAVSRLPYSLADFYDLSPEFYLQEKDIKTINPKESLRILFQKYGPKAKRIKKGDGLTFYFEKAWLNIRPSNTEPILRCVAASQNKKSLKSINE
ncbi:hypothetical protein GW950_02255, partial [Candidatus Wolfebacteria bacterium]|nr:hypothetical protein [Candidatus Wolfebacteria bacterium]